MMEGKAVPGVPQKSSAVPESAPASPAPGTPAPLEADPPAKFDTVLAEELRQIETRRRRLELVGETPADSARGPDAVSQAHEKRPVGLAFSGGGIRSATFNLGILQG